METNDNDHVRGSDTETRNEDPMAGDNKKRKKEEQMKNTNREMINEDQMGGTNKKMKKDVPAEESNMVTNEENSKGRTNMKENEDHPVREKSVNIHDEDIKEESSEGIKKKDYAMHSMPYAESLQDLLIFSKRIQQFKKGRYPQFTSSQREVFEEVVKAVKSGLGQCFFVEARGGRMKLDLLNAILAAVRIEEGDDSALATSYLQLSSHLLLGGRTFHDIFNATPNYTEDLNLHLKMESSRVQNIRRAKVIVVGEAVCLNKLYIEQLDKKLREIAECKIVFGGKVMVLAGDFRQLLPVPADDTDRRELVISRSSLWSKFKVFPLRAQDADSSDGELGRFDEWLQKLGNGDIPIVSAPDYIELPEDMCFELQGHNREESLRDFIQFVFRSFDEDIHDCAILAPTKRYVQEINDACMESMPGTIETFRSVHTSTECSCKSNPLDNCPSSTERHDPPPYRLDLKIGVPLILLATLQTAELSTGRRLTLSTGTRLTLTNISDEHLECTVAGGLFVNIPKIQLQPFCGKVSCQFPVRVSFAMTIHKNQGLMLKRVGVWLGRDVFTHGQLFSAASCVERREDIRFALYKRDDPPYYATRNIVCKEVFQAPVPASPT